MPISHLLELSCAVGIPDVTYRVIGFIATMRSLEALEHVGRVSTRAQYTRDIQCEKNSSRRPWRKLVSMQMFLLTDYNLRMCSHFNLRSGLSEVIRKPTRQLFSLNACLLTLVHHGEACTEFRTWITPFHRTIYMAQEYAIMEICNFLLPNTFYHPSPGRTV
ncbi:hypothetical protein CPB85DRAFT_1323831 [Mucidula mucida]|nr:hypothetical protein CPB85DRAFT_1323831 [Mucidula mucida]